MRRAAQQVVTRGLASSLCALHNRFTSSSSSSSMQQPDGTTDGMEWMAASLFDDLAPPSVATSHARSRDAPQDAVERDEESTDRRRRRERFHAAEALAQVVADELRAEVVRDSRDGVAAIPPLAPAGWDVQHRPGTRLFTMSKFISGRRRRLARSDSVAGGALADVEDAEGPRFRSIRDEHAQRQQPSLTRAPPHASNHHHNNNSSDGSSPRRAVPLAHVVRSDVALTLVAPFCVQDLSLHDPAVSICEYTCFDLIVRKQRPIESGRGDTRHHVQGQERLWSDEQCLYLRLASANSALRLRSVQLVSQRQARLLEHSAFFGSGGDPLFRELLVRQRAVAHERYTTSVTAARSRATRAPSLSSLDEPTTRRQLAQQGSQSSSSSSWSPSSLSWQSPDPAIALPAQDYTSSTLLLHDRGYVGDVARRMCYRGPYLTELSKEFQEALMQYVVSDLGINSVLVEYVNQMMFFMEQEEYMGWLARLEHTATALQKGA